MNPFFKESMHGHAASGLLVHPDERILGVLAELQT